MRRECRGGRGDQGTQETAPGRSGLCTLLHQQESWLGRDIRGLFAVQGHGVLLLSRRCANCTCAFITVSTSCEACTSANGEGRAELVAGRPCSGCRRSPQHHLELRNREVRG